MKNILISCLTVILLMPVAYGLPRDAELVIDDVWLNPIHPKPGDPLTISASVYNNGIVNANSLSSIITVGYFVDDELLFVDDLDNVEPGISNGITISSPPLWNYGQGSNKIKIVIDFHDTLNDKFDSPLDNTIEKVFSITPFVQTDMSLTASPQYFVSEQEIPKITISLFDSDSNMSLGSQEIVLFLNDAVSNLVTDENGKISFLPTVSLSDPIVVKSYFHGHDQYSPSNATMILFPLPQNNSSFMILELTASETYPTFQDNSFEFLIFQDSNSVPLKQVMPNNKNLIDPNTFWISLPSHHEYFAEVYLHDDLIHVTDIFYVGNHDVVVEQVDGLNVGDYATPIIPTWIKNNAGWWADGLIDDSSFVQGMQHLINEDIIRIPPTMPSDMSENETDVVIPTWIKNNAGWWADGLIDDSSFVQGMQHLIKHGYVTISK